MSEALSVFHGRFGRACLYHLDRPFSRHAHREGHLAFYVGGGLARITIDGRRRAVTPDQAVGINPWQPHDFVPVRSSRGALWLVLYIDPRWFLSHSESPSLYFNQPEVNLTDDVTARLYQVVEMLTRERPDDAFEQSLHGLAQACVPAVQPDVAGARRTRPSKPAPGAGTASDRRVRRAIELMSSSLHEGGTLQQVARDAGLSRPHFFKLFQDQTGLTPNLFLNTLRMERALERLTCSDFCVSSIAVDLGFSSQSSFTRFFVSNVGLAPGAYRRAARLL